MLQKNIEQEIEKIRLIDTHEHIMTEEERQKCALDFSYLFIHYNSSDLVSAGMPPRLLEAVRLPIYHFKAALLKRRKVIRNGFEPERMDMTLEERWRAMEPYWNAIQNTSYAKQTLLAIKDIFGFDDLNEQTYTELSEAIANSRKPGWYNFIMKEKAGIDRSILDMPPANIDSSLFLQAVRLDNYIVVNSRSSLANLEEEAGISIHSLDNLVKAMQLFLDKQVAHGAGCIKNGLAYQRTLAYGKVDKHEAETVFNRITRHLGEGFSWSETKPLQDYLMHQSIQAAIDANLPVQIHTGLLEGNKNLITNSNPTLLLNLITEYPQAKFDLFHGGYPYIHEWVVLAKTFPNVYADLSWVHIISPEIGRRLLHELIETVPGNKIFAFGGDALSVEMAYAHSRIARKVVARVLTEKIEDGYLKETEAIKLAHKILCENPAKLFKIKTVE